jgi:hypothetical protein
MEWAFLILGTLVWFELIAIRRALQHIAAFQSVTAKAFHRWNATMPEEATDEPED